MTDKPPATVSTLHPNPIIARNIRRRISKQQRLAADPKEAAREEARQQRARRNSEARDKQLALDFAAPVVEHIQPGVVSLHGFGGDRQYWRRRMLARHAEWQDNPPDDAA